MINSLISDTVVISVDDNSLVFSIKVCDGTVDFFNLILGHVLHVSVFVFDNSGGVNFSEVNSDDSIVAALHEDFTWAFSVLFSLCVAFSATS